MGLCSVEHLITETNIVVFAPHFDDVLFMLGGYILEMKTKGLLGTKRFHVQLIFPRSNYLARTGAENSDISLDRLKLVTGKRLIEDLECLDELMGVGGYCYELATERECLARGKSLTTSEMEFPHGMYDDFDANDRAIFSRIKDRVRLWAVRQDTALVFPMAIKEHIDHFIVREAGVCVAAEFSANASSTFYFQEDKPYGGIASVEELKRIESFLANHTIEVKDYEYDAEGVITLAFKHYISQVEEVYRKGILNRAEQLRVANGSCRPCDRLGKLTLCK